MDDIASATSFWRSTPRPILVLMICSILADNPGRLPNNSWNASRLTTTTSIAVTARTDALRGSLETSAASPNISPRCNLIGAWPSRTTSASPFAIKYTLSPKSPTWKTHSPASKCSRSTASSWNRRNCVMSRGRNTSSIQSHSNRNCPSSPGNLVTYTPRQSNQATMPFNRIPKTSATADRRPNEPSFPNPVNANTCFFVPRPEASMLCAHVFACRSACCAVGGEKFPSTCFTSAQSPSAHTRGLSRTSIPSSTLIRPRSFATESDVSNGCGPAGTVATVVRVLITRVSFVFASSTTTASALTALSPVLSWISTPRLMS